MVNFFSQRIQKPSVLWSVTIELNKLPLFSSKFSKNKETSEIATLKEERSQIMHLMLSGHAGRKIDEDIFSHENSEFPPTLTSAGKMYKGTKSEIINCFRI